MKVFDYTDGTKGEELADVKIAGQVGPYVVVKNDKRYRITLPNAPKGENISWGWHADADNGFGDLKPETFGVEAICFCVGEWFHKYSPGHPEAESHWQWVVLGTDAWNRSACKAGILKAEYLGEAFKN